MCSPDSKEYEEFRVNLGTCNAIFQKTIRQAKAIYYSREFEKNKNDSRKTWCTIKNIIDKSRSSKEFPSYFLIGDRKETDLKTIANKFNDFFTGIGPALAENIKADNSCSYKTFLKQNIASSFQFDLVTNEIVEKII